jgi:hypothetical protein
MRSNTLTAWLAAWGGNWYGQCNVPAGLSNVVAIAAGGYHSLALIREPVQARFMISGRIVHGVTGQGIDGAEVVVQGIGMVITTNGGYYQVEVPQGWSGQVEVMYGQAVFTVGAQSCANVDGDLTGQDFSLTWGEPYDGNWFDLSAFRVVSPDEVLQPGEAYYYLRRGAPTEVRF